MTITTDLEWEYAPSGFFEAPIDVVLQSGALRVGQGQAVLTLTSAVDPIPPIVLELARQEVEAVFAVHRMLTRQRLTLLGPSTVQHLSGGSRILAAGAVVEALSAMDNIDVVVIDSFGNVKSASRSERIAGTVRSLRELGPKVTGSPTLRRMIESFGNSIEDPVNELLHLYEVRDAACSHFGNPRAAQDALAVSRSKWSDFGRIANDEPILHGRHRGKYIGPMRPATGDELELVREVALLIITRFSDTLK